MAEKRRDDDGIEQIKGLRSKAAAGAANAPMAYKKGRDAVSVGVSPLDATGGAGESAAMKALNAIAIKPWGQDRVTLTLQAQLLMVEHRGSLQSIANMNLDYRNRISILEFSPGLYLKIEPTGCYKVSYNNR